MRAYWSEVGSAVRYVPLCASFSAAIDVREYCTRLPNGVACPVGDWRLNKKNHETDWNTNNHGGLIPIH
jgi:hypothetical protein